MSDSESATSPVVGLVMGSDSDWPVMSEAAAVLREFGVPFEADVVSAHRMPTEMIDYGRSAAQRGLRVIIAGAGGAAHLPGMLASVTPLPVIGVPVPLKYLDGMDSLLSIVQMPAGVPVATVSIGARELRCARRSAATTPENASSRRSGQPMTVSLPSPGFSLGNSILGQLSMTTARPASSARLRAATSMTPSCIQMARMPRRSFSAIA